MKQVVVDADDTFIDSDPMDGRNWKSTSGGTTSWDSIYPSSTRALTVPKSMLTSVSRLHCR